MQQKNKGYITHIKTLTISTLFLTAFGVSFAKSSKAIKFSAPEQIPDSTTSKDRKGDFVTDKVKDPYYLKDPSVIKKTVEYDPKTKKYIVTEKIGDQYYRNPTYLTYEEYMQQSLKESNQQYWKDRGEAVNLIEKKGLAIPVAMPGKKFDNIFGEGGIQIVPQGAVDITIGGNYQKIANPSLTPRQQRQGGFDFDMGINMSVTGKIGDKLQTTLKYNTQGGFDFNNQIKLQYQGKEDDIIKEISAGNVNFTLPTQLINGSQNLWGVKGKFQFGRLTMTHVFSEQKSQKQSITLDNGAQTQRFELNADQYEANRHFFLSQYFRDNYEKALNNLPVINSQITITSCEVWVTNRQNKTQNVRDIVAFMDLGESKPYASTINSFGANRLPDNGANDLFQRISGNQQVRSINTAINELQTTFQLQPFQDFEKTYARKLEPSEYTLFPTLGFITLNTSLNPNEVLAVSFQYTYNGQVYQVGDFSRDIPIPDSTSNVPNRMLFLKMLKGTATRPQLPVWDLMMKNVYSLGGYGINKPNFKLEIFYNDPVGGQKRYIPQGKLQGIPLVRVSGLDKVNNNGDPQPDGIFDFLPNITINPQNGRIYFPVVEPFGEHLKSEFVRVGDANIAPTYVFQQLYDSTQVIAQQFPEYNRFVLKGTYQSTTASRISLGAFNIPQGSVVVSLNGQRLVEGQDYTVDYNLGQVQVNENILKAGGQVKVDYENNATFGIQTKTFMGSRFDYRVSDKFNIGATFVKLKERPFTQKVNIGEDPINNTMLGADIRYADNLPFLTKVLDKLPFYSTKEMSNISLNAEVAHLIPGHHKNINIGGESTVFIDDFEGASSGYNVGTPFTSWHLSSTPKDAIDGNGRRLFPEAYLSNDVRYGFNRAKLSWYNIAQFLQTDQGNTTPDYLRNDPKARWNHYVRQVEQTEIYNRDVNGQINPIIQTFDLSFYPKERGQYNLEFSPSPTPNISAGINPDGTLKVPQSRWGGIQRSLDNTNFEANNIEYVSFWLLDPFMENPTNKGDLYLNLGTISEDVLKDSRMAYENGMEDVKGASQNLLDSTIWSWVPRTSPLNNAFSNDENARKYQDVGLDGVTGDNEREHYADFLTKVQSNVNPAVYTQLATDPSNDNFKHYLDNTLIDNKAPILQLYKNMSNPDGNSPVQTNTNDIARSGTLIPDNEDINKDNTLNESEQYYQYRIPLYQGMSEANHPYIISSVKNEAVDKENGKARLEPWTWYQFRVPIRKPDNKVGGISDFRNIQFMRMFLTNFQDSVILRMANLELVRNQWRIYEKSLENGRDVLPPDKFSSTTFNVNSVSLENNSKRIPVNYVLPPNIERQLTTGQTRNTVQMNEQSMATSFCNLKDGDSRATFKTLEMDFRRYKNLKMYIHAEAKADGTKLRDKDVTAFIRLGSDFTENYYEYEVPLKVTPAITPPAYYNTDDPLDREKVWMPDNEVNILLSDLIDVKKKRNIEGASQIAPYTTTTSDGRLIRIVGNPNIGSTKMAMLGVRNPAVNDPNNPLKGAEDDGQPKCGEIWFNELRLTGLDERGGTAALANANIKLADLGTVGISANYHSKGFGQVEQKVQQRAMDDFVQYSVTSSLQLGRLFPKKLGLQIPFYAQVAQSFSIPEFDPYTLDIRYADQVGLLKTFYPDSVKSYKQTVQTRKTTKGYSFTGVRIVPAIKQTRPHFYDIQNFSLSYSYNQILKSDPFVKADDQKNYTGELNYNFGGQPRYWKPFGKAIKSENKYWGLIKDLNFNIFPNSISFGNKLDRRYGVFETRNLQGETYPIQPTYDKYFTWDRTYGFSYNPFQSLNFNFNATNKSRIDEPTGAIDTKEKEQVIKDNLMKGGRNTFYTHSIATTYNLPFAKIPILDFINVNTGYNASVTWNTGPLRLDSIGNVIKNPQGNTINSTQAVKVTSNLNFDQLYNKSPWIKKYNTPQAQLDAKQRIEKENSVKTARDKTDGDIVIQREKIKKYKQDLIKLKENEKLPDSTKALQKKVLKAQIKAAKKQIKSLKKNKRNLQYPVEPAATPFIQPLLMVKKVTVNYDETKSTTLPGYMGETKILGRDPSAENPLDWEFLAGKQPGYRLFAPRDKYASDRFLEDMARKGLITSDTLFNLQYTQTYSKNITATATLEPFRDLKIDLNLKSVQTQTHTEIYKKISENTDFQHLTPIDMGSYTYSNIHVPTLFDKLDADGVNNTYRTFEENRKIISQRFADQNPNASTNVYYDPQDSTFKQGYREGYGPTNQSVLIPAFLAAYQKKDAGSVSLNPFSAIPLPNWTLTYNGLTRFKLMKKIFKSFSLTHSYSSDVTIGSYSTDLRYTGDGTATGANKKDSLTNNYYPLYAIPQIVVNESMNPVGINFTTTNNITGRFDFRKARTLSMNFTDYQMIENSSSTYTFGLGYKIKGMKFPIKIGSKQIVLKNDLTFTFDFSYKDNITVNHKLGQGISIVTAGNKQITIGPKIDYIVSDKINISLFYNRSQTIPYIANSYPITSTNGGIRIRLSLAP